MEAHKETAYGLDDQTYYRGAFYKQVIGTVYEDIFGNKKYNVTPGTIVEIVKEGFVVATLDGSLVITDVKPFGKKRMFANSFANGYRDLVGKVLK